MYDGKELNVGEYVVEVVGNEVEFNWNGVVLLSVGCWIICDCCCCDCWTTIVPCCGLFWIEYWICGWLVCIDGAADVVTDDKLSIQGWCCCGIVDDDWLAKNIFFMLNWTVP